MKTGRVTVKPKGFNDLGNLWTSDGKMKCEMDRQKGAASAVM